MEKLFYSTDDLVELGLFGSKGIIHKKRSDGSFPIPGVIPPGERKLRFAAEDVKAYIKLLKELKK